MQQHSAVRFGIIRRHAVVIDSAETEPRDLEGQLAAIGMLKRGPSYRDSINSKLWCTLVKVINFEGQTYHDVAVSQMCAPD